MRTIGVLFKKAESNVTGAIIFNVNEDIQVLPEDFFLRKLLTIPSKAPVFCIAWLIMKSNPMVIIP